MFRSLYLVPTYSMRYALGSMPVLGLADPDCCSSLDLSHHQGLVWHSLDSWLKLVTDTGPPLLFLLRDCVTAVMSRSCLPCCYPLLPLLLLLGSRSLLLSPESKQHKAGCTSGVYTVSNPEYPLPLMGKNYRLNYFLGFFSPNMAEDAFA